MMNKFQGENMKTICPIVKFYSSRVQELSGLLLFVLDFCKSSWQ